MAETTQIPRQARITCDDIRRYVASGRLQLLFDLRVALPGSVPEATTAFFLELFEEAQSLAVTLDIFENENEISNEKFFHDGKIINIPAAVDFGLGALSRVDAIASSSPSLDFGVLREEAAKLALAIHRIALGATYWGEHAYDMQKIRAKRTLFDSNEKKNEKNKKKKEKNKVYDIGSANAHLPDAQVVDSAFKNIDNWESLINETLLLFQSKKGLSMQNTHVEGRSDVFKWLRDDRRTPKHIIQFLDALICNIRHIFGFPDNDKLAEALGYEIIMTKFRISGIPAPFQEQVTESGAGVANCNIKDFLLSGSTFHPDHPDHRGDRHTSYAALAEESVALLAFQEVFSELNGDEVKKIIGKIFGIQFTDLDQALFGRRKTFGKEPVEGNRSYEHMAAHRGRYVMCWMHDGVTLPGHKIPGKAHTAAYLREKFPLLQNLPPVIVSDNGVLVTRDQLNKFFTIIPTGVPVQAGQWRSVAEREAKTRGDIRQRVAGLKVPQQVENALLVLLLKTSIPYADASDSLDVLEKVASHSSVDANGAGTSAAAAAATAGRVDANEADPSAAATTAAADTVTASSVDATGAGTAAAAATTTATATTATAIASLARLVTAFFVAYQHNYTTRGELKAVYNHYPIFKEAVAQYLEANQSRVCASCGFERLDEFFTRHPKQRFCDIPCTMCEDRSVQRYEIMRSGKLSEEDGKTWLHACFPGKHFVLKEQMKTKYVCFGCTEQKKAWLQNRICALIDQGVDPCLSCGRALTGKGSCDECFNSHADRNTRMRAFAAASGGTIQFCSKCSKLKSSQRWFASGLFDMCHGCMYQQQQQQRQAVKDAAPEAKAEDEAPVAASAAAADTDDDLAGSEAGDTAEEDPGKAKREKRAEQQRNRRAKKRKANAVPPGAAEAAFRAAVANGAEENTVKSFRRPAQEDWSTRNDVVVAAAAAEAAAAAAAAATAGDDLAGTAAVPEAGATTISSLPQDTPAPAPAPGTVAEVTASVVLAQGASALAPALTPAAAPAPAADDLVGAGASITPYFPESTPVLAPAPDPTTGGVDAVLAQGALATTTTVAAAAGVGAEFESEVAVGATGAGIRDETGGRRSKAGQKKYREKRLAANASLPQGTPAPAPTPTTAPAPAADDDESDLPSKKRQKTPPVEVIDLTRSDDEENSRRIKFCLGKYQY